MRTELNLEDLKEIELQILEYIDQVCRENNIDYYLDGGTLLGAVRHKGYIPWDDDIDLTVNRRDFKKLMTLLNQGDGRYKALSMYDHEDYYYFHAKVVDTQTELIEDLGVPIRDMGVFVDIFPLENFPNQKLKRRIMQTRVRILRAAHYAVLVPEEKAKSLGTYNKMLRALYKKKGWRAIQEKVDNMLSALTEPTDYMSDIVGVRSYYNDAKAAYFKEKVYLEFEGRQFPAPSRYDEYLTLMYGDYMTMPPVEQRVTHHSFSAYRR